MELTRREIKKAIRKSSIEEVISGLDLELGKHAIDVKNEDIIEVAYRVQAPDGPRADRLTKIIMDKKVHIFHNFSECQIPPKTRIELILIEDIYVLKSLEESKNA